MTRGFVQRAVLTVADALHAVLAWRDRPRRPVDPPRVHHRLGPPGPAPKTEADR